MTWQTCHCGEMLWPPVTALPALAVCVHVCTYVCAYTHVCIMLCPSYVDDPVLGFFDVLVWFYLARRKKGQRSQEEGAPSGQRWNNVSILKKQSTEIQ